MWTLPEKKERPIYQEIMQLILSYVKEGKLMTGEKLPSERKLALYFGVNRSTVVHALEELAVTGHLIRKQGSGTIVNEGKWGLFTRSTVDWRNYLTQSAFQRKSPFVEIADRVLHQNSDELIDTYTGELPLEIVPALSLPAINWKAFLKEEDQQDDLGYVPLRTKICENLQKEYALEIKPEELMVTSGAHQALFLIIQVLLKPGDWVAIEEPSSFYPLSLFQAAGIRLFGVPMAKDGMDLNHLEKGIHRHKIKLVLVNPSFQNPTGATMSREKREALIQLCRNKKVPIVEDDVFGQLYFEPSNKAVPLKKMDPDNVLYIGSLSKVLGSTTKIGWLSAPSQVLLKLSEARREMDSALSIFPQVIATYALSDKKYYREIEKLRGKLYQRCQDLVTSFSEKKSDSFSYRQPAGGYFLWVKIECGRNIGNKEVEELLKMGLAIMPDFIFGIKNNYVRLNFARLDQGKAKRTVEILARAVEQWKKKS